MLGKRVFSMKKLVAKVDNDRIHHNNEKSQYECLLRERDQKGESSPRYNCKTPTGSFALYIGEGRQRFVVPTTYLSHPLIKILLEKAYDELLFEGKSGLVLPCSVSTFQEVLNAVECCNKKFDFGDLVEEFI